MRNITENLWNSTRGSKLYCVWVPVHADGGDRLVSIWIDPALTAFKSCAHKTPDGIGAAATRFAGHQEKDVDLFVAERLASVLPLRT
jgi:hypothetical protein